MADKPTTWKKAGSLSLSKSGMSLLFKINNKLYTIPVSRVKGIVDGTLKFTDISEPVDNSDTNKNGA